VALFGLLALHFPGYTRSFTAMIGFVALVGIEIKWRRGYALV
jgi:Cu/Ag efflux pump CusA